MIGEDYTNLGYGTEAKHLVLDFSFNHSSFIKILSYVYSYNERSRAYSFKCGYIQEAMMSGVKFHNEKYWDEWILSITKKQWIPVWENYKKKHE
jgi:RimJ/RimL family protein N-acetyltransferase